MATLNSSIGVTVCVIIQFLVAISTPFVAVALNFVHRLYVPLLDRIFMTHVAACIASSVAASVGFHMLVQRITREHYFVILTNLNVTAACFHAIVMLLDIIDLVALAVAGPLRGGQFVFHFVYLLMPGISLSLAVYLCATGRRVGGVPAKRNAMSVLL